MLLPRRYDSCRSASLPTSSPLHAAIAPGRTGARGSAACRVWDSDKLRVVVPLRLACASAPSAREAEKAELPPRGARRYRSGPPGRSGATPYQDIIGIDPGALPTEVTPLLNAPCRHDGGGGPQSDGRKQVGRRGARDGDAPALHGAYFWVRGRFACAVVLG